MKRLFLILLVGLTANAAFAQNDTIVVSNGDRIVGELKSLSRKVAVFDTDYADSEFNVDWDEVTGLATSTQVIVHTSDNERYVGTINYSPELKQVLMVTDSGVFTLKTDDIVAIETFNNKFLDRLTVSIAAGYSFAKANSVQQFSSSASAVYTGDKWRFSAAYNGLIASQEDVDTSRRNSGNLKANRDIGGKAYTFIGLELLESTEQSLDLRATTSMGLGMYFIRKNGLLFQGGVGLAYTNENYSGPANDRANDMEGLVSINFDAYDIGDFSISAGTTMYPSFTTQGRVRLNSDVALKWDLPYELYVKASFRHNFDSKPQTSGVDKGDYVFQTSIGWDWND
ncbi:MAG: DUF481 domain-containing protein [Mangrovibacterium sp.]